MSALLFSHAACMEHEVAPGHPESPGRLRAIAEALSAPEFDGLDRREAPMIDPLLIEYVHDPDYVRAVMAAFPEEGSVRLDADTAVNPGSKEASLRAAGGVVAAVDAVMSGEAKRAFCAVRPPGHHAEPDQAMGFCIFNNVAIGAVHAQRVHGAERVAVMDFDVHHGNGTQAMFEKNASLMFASTHQSPLYPGTGRLHEAGVAGNIVNAPLEPFAGSDAFTAAMEDRILPALRRFDPDLILISAGFDAHGEDPLAQMMLTEDDYGWATEALIAVAEDCCGGRVVSTLEGGYNLSALGRSVATHVQALGKDL